MGNKSSSKLGDTRLEKSFALLVGAMVTRYSVSLRQLSSKRSEEKRFGNLINNERILPEKLLSHYWSLNSYDFADKHLLVISDSSTLSFNKHAHRTDLGFVGPKTSKRGFNVHPSIVANAATLALYGIGGITFHKKESAVTEAEKTAQKARYRRLADTPFEEKERYKWFASPKQAVENCSGAKRYTLIGDRESDIYDVMSRTLEQEWDFLFRSRVNRLSSTGPKLQTIIDKWRVQHTCKVMVSATKKRSAHKAKLELKYGQINIARPDRADKNLPDEIPLYVIQVTENPDSVKQGEEAVHWILLTSHLVTNVPKALQIVNWYCFRWTIEQVFRTLKLKGLNIEQSQTETYFALKNLTTFSLIAAVQIMQLVQARDGHTLQKIQEVFLPDEIKCLKALNQKLEGKTQKQKNPHPPDSLAFAAWVIARLGGWKGYKSERPPGPITFFNGLTKFCNILEGFYLIL